MEKEKIVQAIEILKELDIDVWMLIDRESELRTDPMMDYVTGSGVTWLSFFLFFKGGQKYAVVGNLDIEKMQNLGLFDETFAYKGSPKEILLNLLKKHDPRKIALDFSVDSPAADGLTHGDFLNLSDLLRGTPFLSRLISAESLIARLRGRKSGSEIEKIKRAIDMTLKIFEKVTHAVKPGMSELQVADLISRERIKKGVKPAWEEKSCPAVFTGPQTIGAHSGPTDKILERGHVFNIDFGVNVEKYCSDLQRTWYILREDETEPPLEVSAGFKTLIESIRLSFEALKPGIRGVDIDAIARSYLLANGFDEYPHALGHQIGRSAHDGGALLAPAWERYGQLPFQPLEKDLVFTIEPRIYIKHFGVITVEEIVVIRQNGAEFLSKPQRKLWLIR